MADDAQSRNPIPVTLVAFDLETTGLSARRNRIMELGAVKFTADGTVTDTLSSFANPGQPIPIQIQRLTGITEEMVADAEPPSRVVASLEALCGESWIVGHGIKFDISFCRAIHPGMFATSNILDTVDLARVICPTLERYSLSLISKELQLEHAAPHRAWSDADATRALLMHLVHEAQRFPAELIQELISLAEHDPTPGIRLFLLWIAELPTQPLGRRNHPNRTSKSTGKSSGSLKEGTVVEHVRTMFGPDGVVSHRPSFLFRPEQLQMAQAVAQTLERQQIALVEAGTGTGKTLAYSIPLLLHTALTKNRAVIATHTLALQHQLLTADLPIAQELIGVPLRIALLKGRAHYVNPVKLKAWITALHEGMFPTHCPQDVAIRFGLRLLVWEANTSTGDRGELQLTSDEVYLWNRVAATNDADSKLTREESHDAFVYLDRARAAALSAHVVVTTHALLVADSEQDQSILGEYTALVIDEAHHLEEVATEQHMITVSLLDVMQLLQRASATGMKQMAPPKGTMVLATATTAYQHARYAAQHLPSTDIGTCTRVNFGVLERELAGSGAQLATTLLSLAHQIRDQLTGVGDDITLETTGPQNDFHMELATMLRGIEAFLGNSPTVFVTWIECADSDVRLCSAPLRVDEAVAAILGKADSTVLTSATLSLGGSFAFIRSRLGIPERAHELAVHNSDRNFLAHASCIIPDDMPAQGDLEYDRQFAASTASIVRALQGHTMVLFTSYTSLKKCHQFMIGELAGSEIAVLGQGIDGTLNQLVSGFRAAPCAVLLGTGALWEGIDIPGNLVRCVIVAKLPFPVPTDPLLQARSREYPSPFNDFFLPLAALKLKQGFGRLVRSEDDRGAVVIADARITKKEYGKAFLAVLPDVPVHHTVIENLTEEVVIAVDGNR